jgi:hypothetical protein
MNAQDIARSILTSSLTLADLSVIRDAYMQKADAIQRTTRLQFAVGDTVKSRRFGLGKVYKIGPKNIYVKAANGVDFRSSPSLLERV